MIKSSHIRQSAPVLSAALAVMLVLCSCGQGQQPKAIGNKPQVAPRNEQAPYDGIDISSHQGFIDWAKVSSDKNIRFVYIKATEGATYQSSHYRRNVEGARRHGILVGSYHYVTSTSAIAEAMPISL